MNNTDTKPTENQARTSDVKRNTSADIYTSKENERYPEKILEAQGDLADRAEIEIEQEIEEAILRARQNLARTKT